MIVTLSCSVKTPSTYNSKVFNSITKHYYSKCETSTLISPHCKGAGISVFKTPPYPTHHHHHHHHILLSLFLAPIIIKSTIVDDYNGDCVRQCDVSVVLVLLNEWDPHCQTKDTWQRQRCITHNMTMMTMMTMMVTIERSFQCSTQNVLCKAWTFQLWM